VSRLLIGGMGGLLHYQGFLALVILEVWGLSGLEILLTRQISRLETRIKECIRVESIVVRKPKCVMKVNRMEGVNKRGPGTFCRSEFF
jgi:hypothetical protein